MLSLGRFTYKFIVRQDRAEEMESTQTQTLTQRDSLAIAKKNFDQMDPKLQEKKVGWRCPFLFTVLLNKALLFNNFRD